MSRPLPGFLKRPGKRDSGNSHGFVSPAASFSSSSASSIRFSTLGGEDDDDFFSVSARSSPPPPVPTPLEEHGDFEEAAEEALIADYSPMSGLEETTIVPEGDSEAERAQSLGEYLIRQASISVPPDVTPSPLEETAVEAIEGEEETTMEKDKGKNEDVKETKKGSPPRDSKTLDSTNLLQDLDQVFDSLPKPQKKAKKKASEYAKPKSAPRPTLLQPVEKKEPLPVVSQPVPPPQPADSVFDTSDTFLDVSTTRMRKPPPPRDASLDSSTPVEPVTSSSPPSLPPPKPSSPSVEKPPLVPGLHSAPFSAPSHAPTIQETSDSSESPVTSGAFTFSNYRLTVPVFLFLSILFLRLLPSTAFVFGFIWGAAASLGCVQLYHILTTRSEPVARVGQAPDLNTLPPPSVPQVEDEPDDGGGVFRGWLNELSHYKPYSYHINQTCSVFVTLDGTQLRIQRPKQNVQKRAMWNETLPTRQTVFIHQRHFDMMGARVVLEPQGLVKKRVWSKKYPIVLLFGNVPSTGGMKRSNQNTPDDFEWVEPDEERLFLFARTCREKEEWFRRFEAAARGKPLQLSLKRIVETYLEVEGSSLFAPHSEGESGGGDSASVSFTVTADHGTTTTTGGIPSSPDVHVSTKGASDTDEWTDRLQGSEREPLAVAYTRYMARFMPADWLLRAVKTHRLDINYVRCDPQMLWVNAVLGRAVWDLLREQFWADKVKQKIQNKLRKIHLPYFIDELTVVEIALGKCFPVIRRAGKPFLNSRGLWVELDIWYSGGGSMALVTKINLMKLRKRRHDNTESKSGSESGHSSPSIPTASSTSTSSHGVRGPNTSEMHSKKTTRNGACCSEEEDSAESTTDSELDENPDSEIVTDPDKGNHIGGGTSRKLLRFVDRIARSSYFHKAIENSKIIQRGMEYVSNTPIELHVELKFLSGTLLVNIPPPPTDRLWYGFKPVPNIVITARPKVGEKELTLARLTEWIEKKLLTEFQRVFVMPNMDDLVIPLLLSGNPEGTVGPTENAHPCS